MLQLIAFGLAAGAGVQAFRNFPADGPASTDSVAVVFAAGVLLAYLGGLWRGRGRGSATATATASAESHAAAVASNQINLAVVMPGQGAAPGFGLPSETAPWLAGATDRQELSLDQLDGQELSDFVEEAEVMER